MKRAASTNNSEKIQSKCLYEFLFYSLVSTASQNKRARHRNVIFDGIAGDSQCKYFKKTKLRQ